MFGYIEGDGIGLVRVRVRENFCSKLRVIGDIWELRYGKDRV